MLTLIEIKKRMANILLHWVERQGGICKPIGDISIFQDIYGKSFNVEMMHDMEREVYANKRLQEMLYRHWAEMKLYDPKTGTVDREKLKELQNSEFDQKLFFSMIAESNAQSLIGDGHFTENELQENSSTIGKHLHQLCLTFYKHQVHDEKGEAIEAQKIISDYLKTADFGTESQVSPSPSISEVKEHSTLFFLKQSSDTSRPSLATTLSNHRLLATYATGWAILLT